MKMLKKISSHIFYRSPDHELDQPCLYAIVGNDKTLMIDGGVSAALAREFVEAVRRETGRGVDFVVLTHWHWDHVFGLAGIGAPLIACKNTAAHLKRMASYASWGDEALDARIRSGVEITDCAFHIRKTYPGSSRSGIVIRQPDIVFEGALTLHLGGLTCELMPLPPVHTNDCVAIRVPEERLLFIGDSTGQNSYDHPAHYSVPAVLELFEFIRGVDARLIMESHAEPASPAEFEACNQILLDAANGVLAGLHDKPLLMEHLRQRRGSSLPDDIDEIAEMFIAGINR